MVKSWAITGKAVLKNSHGNPSGPGDLLEAIENNTFLISSAETPASNFPQSSNVHLKSISSRSSSSESP
ncbi:hypothetical protein Bca101_036429 [Brassica carinata]